MKTYQDERMRQTVQKIIKLQQQEKYVIAGYRAEFGLPTRDMLMDQESLLSAYRDGHDYTIGNHGFLDYDHKSGQYLYTLKSGSSLPAALKQYRRLQLKEASIDQANRLVKIISGDETIVLRHAPVWCPPYELMSQINKELKRTKTGIVVWKLDWENEDTGKYLFETGVPRLRNEQTMVYLSGYAIDLELKNLIYAGCFGYKTSIESIRASTQSSKVYTISFEGQTDFHLSTTGKYRYLWKNLPEYSNHHACFIQYNALPKHWSPDDIFAYVLVFQDEKDPETALKHAFIQRLGDVLELPVLESWQNKIWAHAEEAELIQKLETAGDCKAGIRIDLQADWKTLFETMLENQEILVQ